MLKSLFPIVTKKHVERRILRTPPKHLFRIIQDVDRYTQFLPLCSYSKILKRSPCESSFDAKLTVGLSPLFSETYTSHVRVHQSKHEWTVNTKSIDSSLFESLESRWVLKQLQHEKGTQPSSDVDFWVQMSVRDPLVAQTLDHVLQEVAGRQVEAFEKRCNEVPIRDEDLGLLEQ